MQTADQTEYLFRKSFTLVELLIVVAIIAILAGLLLPALNIAREKGKTTLCLSNQKQNYLAFAQYGNDFGYYPAARWSWDGQYYKEFWYFKLLPYLGFGRNMTDADWITAEDIRTWKSLNCPSLERISPVGTAAFAMNGFLNTEDIGLRGSVSYLPGKKDEPHYLMPGAGFSNGLSISKLVLAGDMNCGKSGTTDPCIANGQLFDDSYLVPITYTASMRHLGKKNILFLDGTVVTWGKTQMGNHSENLRYKLYYENK